MKTAKEWGRAHGLAFYPGDPRDPPDGGEWGDQEDFIAAVQRDALEAAAQVCEAQDRNDNPATLRICGASKASARAIRDLKP